MMKVLPTLVATLLTLSPLAATAVPLLYDFTNGTDSIVFQTDSNPVPDLVNVSGENFILFNVPGTFNSTDLIIDEIAFFGGASPGFDITINGMPSSFFGPQVFQGTLAAPTIVPGSYSPYVPGCSFCVDQTSIWSLEITAVSEPAVFGLLAIGLLSMGLQRVRVGTRRRGSRR